MSCPQFAAIDEYLAVGVPPGLLPGQHRQHLESCADCQREVEGSLELNQLLAEPLPLPPPDLTARIMAAVRKDRPAPVSPAWERLVWASVGAAAASLVPLLQSGWLDPVGEAGSDLVASLAAALPSWNDLPTFSWAWPAALALLLLQATMLWRLGKAR